MFQKIKQIGQITCQDLYSHYGEVECGELVFRPLSNDTQQWIIESLMVEGYLYHWVEQGE